MWTAGMPAFDIEVAGARDQLDLSSNVALQQTAAFRIARPGGRALIWCVCS